MDYLNKSIEDYAFIPSPGNSFRKLDYSPLPYYYPLSIQVGHFLYHHLDALPKQVQCKASEGNTFRQKLARFHIDIELKNKLLALYLYCQGRTPKTLNNTSSKIIRQRIGQYKNALRNPIVSDKEKDRLKYQLQADEHMLSVPWLHQAHRPCLETYYHAAIYVLGQIYSDEPNRYRKIGRLFEVMFDRKTTRNIIGKILNYKPETIKHDVIEKMEGWSL